MAWGTLLQMWRQGTFIDCQCFNSPFHTLQIAEMKASLLECAAERSIREITSKTRRVTQLV